MTEQFKRDMGRYIVIKSSDMKVLHPTTLVELHRAIAMTNTYREMRDKAPLQCVVVESDWPEYERVWAMIEARVTGEVDQVVVHGAGIIDRYPGREDRVLRPSEAPLWECDKREAFARPSGHGPLAWFLAAVDDAREQGHENMILPRGLGNMIAEHISQLESQLAKFQQMATIYQVESTVKKDSEGNVTKLEWVDVSKEDADKAWNEFGLLVRTVRLEVKK